MPYIENKKFSVNFLNTAIKNVLKFCKDHLMSNIC